MSAKTFTGSCHCGHVRFEADIDFDAGTGREMSRCNCSSLCTRMRFWGAIVKPSAFRLLHGQSVLTDYRFDSESVHHPFCKYCGVHAFTHGNIEAIGGEFFSINLACLDDANFSELADAPARYSDGRNNSWFNAPEEARHANKRHNSLSHGMGGASECRDAFSRGPEGSVLRPSPSSP